MNCATVRDRLAEHALGALAPRDVAPVDRHLAWCAACRKEAGELQRATATLAFGVAPHEPPVELEERTIAAVHQAVEQRDRRASTPRRSRLTLIAALTGMLAVLGTGWGAVMANRAADSDRLVQLETLRSQSAVERFRDLLNSAEFGDPEDEVFLGTLSPSATGGGGGAPSRSSRHRSSTCPFVLVNGLPQEAREQLPFTVRLRGDDGVLVVGRIEKGDLDDSGAGIVMREFDELVGYDSVVVRNVDGDIVMSGSMQTRATVTSPGP